MSSKLKRRIAHTAWMSLLLVLSFSMTAGAIERGLLKKMKTEQRVALIIGNGAYRNTPLRNPANDARAMTKALKACGFRVIGKTNCDRKEMRQAIRDFGDLIKRGGVGVFYYAGHGIQVKGENFLVPVGADVQAEDEVEDECILASSVLRKMESAGNRVNIVIMDACRNNPFARSFRSGSRGLARMDAATGSIVAYATAPGKVAADAAGGAKNGLYTSMLLKYLREPGVKIEDVFKNVRRDVMAASSKTQVPWESSSLTGDFYFSLPASSESLAPPALSVFGHLQVNVNASGSRVFVDGVYREEASPGVPLNLQNVGLGEMEVRVEASGYKPVTKWVTLKSNQWTQVVFELPVISAPVPPPTPPRPSVSHGETTTFLLPGGATMEMVWIDSGTFTMGSPSSEPGQDSDEGPRHKVMIIRRFYLDKYEITQGQWESVMGTRPWAGQDYVRSGSEYPAAYISWNDVQAFIARLNQEEGAAVYRLSTEAEWEYACRAGTTTGWSFGDDESLLGQYAWYDANAWDVGEKYAHAVGTKLPNPWGLYDMYGNVWEWCQDWYEANYYSVSPSIDPAPTLPASGSARVIRGGGFADYAWYVRSANRNSYSPGSGRASLGVRLLRQEP